MSPAPGRAETGTAESSSTASDTADASADAEGVTTELPGGSTTEASGSESGTTDSCDDVEVSDACDPWAQDCPACQKCVWYANDGSPPWNATSCRALPPEPRAVGESCTLEGSQYSGINDCDVGAMCWDADPETNAGVCAALCTGSREDPECPGDDLRCTVVLGSEAHLCIPTCDPLRGSCPGAGVCVFVGDAPQGFVCMPPALIDAIDLGAPCSYVGSACGEATVCAPQELALDCLDPVGCCAALCDRDAADSCAWQPGTSCAAWPLWNDEAPPGYAHVGVCLAP